MILDSRVIRLSPDRFRFSLSTSDINTGEGSGVVVSSSNSSLYDSNGQYEYVEEALVFLDSPIVVPSMSYVYRVRLYSVTDPYLDRVIGDLMFLNPGIGVKGLNKLTSWVVSYFVGIDDNGDKVLRYEDLRPIVSRLSISEHQIIESDRIILYKDSSLLFGKDKRWYSNVFRSRYISTLKGELIHQGALLASKRVYEHLILSRMLVLHHTNGINSVNTLNKYIEDRTLRFLEDSNYSRHFKTQVTAKNFVKFLDCYRPDLALTYYVDNLGISKRTAVDFRNLMR